MKLNFMRNDNRELLQAILQQFCDDYRIDLQRNTFARGYLVNPPGHEKICEWLVDRGYRAKPFTFGPMSNGEYVAFGINFDDNCPLFVEMKLKLADEVQP